MQDPNAPPHDFSRCASSADIQTGERPGYGPGVLLLYKREDLWYKKIDHGFVVVPVASFHRLEFCFSPAEALVFMAGAFIIRLCCGYRAPCGRVGDGASPAGGRRGVSYNLQNCR